MTELEQYTGLLDLETGELLPATADNIGRVLMAARAMKRRVDEIVREATDAAVAISEHQGTKTLHGEKETITLTGGISVDYDPMDLMQALEVAGCPDDRILAAVTPVVTYKVDRAVLRQLSAANPDYKAAIQLAEHEVDRPYRASVKLRKGNE